MFFKPVIIIIILSIIGTIGDSFMKLAGSGQKFIEWRWFVLGSFFYTSTMFGWFYVMKYIKLSSLGIIYALTSALFLAGIGIFYFHEKLNIYEIIGIIVAILSIILLSKFA